MVVVFEKVKYYGNETSVGYSVESVEKDGHITYRFDFEGHLVDEHYILQESRKFQRRKEPRADLHTNIFGVAHSSKEADNRLYTKAINEAKGMAQRYGEDLEDKVSPENKPSSKRPTLLRQMMAFTSAEPEHD